MDPTSASQCSRAVPFLALALVGGCAAVPELGPAPAPRGAETIASARSLTGTEAGSWPSMELWADYGDAQLAGLVAEALRNSPDVAVAAARVRRAAGSVQEAGASRLPRVDAEGGATLDKQSTNNGIPAEIIPNGVRGRGQLAAIADLDLDLWGRNRAALAAATSEQRAAEVDAAQARLLLSAAVASTYSDLAAAFAELDVRQRTVEARQASRDLIARRLANGLENTGSLRQADAEVANARAVLAQSGEAITLRRNQLAALLGAGPDRGLDIARPSLAALPLRALPEGVTTDLVGRRPDIVAARERVEAAARRIDVARADFYPAIRLGALVGLQSLGFGNLVDSGSLYGNVGPAVSLPIFRGGAIEGRYRTARAGFDESVADYDRTVVNAYRKVADAVSGGRAAATRLREAQAALAASEDAYRVARSRYEGGLSNYLEVLAVEDRVLAARLATAAVEAEARASDIELLRALGGGFSSSAAASPMKETADA